MSKKLYYKIGEACRVLEIQPYVLRYWETEFPALSPEKSRSGQRTYSEADMAIIGRIKELLYEEGYTIAGAKKKLDGELASGDEPSPVKKAAAGRKKAPEDEAAAEAPAAPSKVTEEPVPEPKPARKKPSSKAAAPKKSVPKSASKKPVSAAADPARIAKLEKGIEQALAEARNILDLLDSTSTSK